ncbi:MAG TPA: hypothetical protein VN578_11790 [Candidatus Binatia bacterium]|jgi:hypothetical protein|nr:hypothetical protein [Candidatus Binatia bacterium]
MKPESIIPIAFPLVFLSVIVWFFMVSALYRRLRQHHPEKFHAMGEPTLFFNNPPRASLILLRFLFKREDTALNDPSLSSLSKTMLVFILCFLFVFVSLIAVMLSAAPVHHAH